MMVPECFWIAFSFFMIGVIAGVGLAFWMASYFDPGDVRSRNQ